MEFQEGQEFINSDKKTITIMANVEGWLMCKKETGFPFLYTIADFRTAIIKNCGYKLNTASWEYKEFPIIYKNNGWQIDPADFDLGWFKTKPDCIAFIDDYMETYAVKDASK